MANTYKNIVITPNRSSNTADPKVVYSGGNTTANTDITLNVYPDSNGTLSWEGSAGQLFSITNDLSNNLFGVNDVSGIPSLEVYANGLVSIAPFGGNVVIGNTAEFILSPGTGLHANGSFGTAGQVLHTNGSAVYWAADDNAGGTVTSVASANGIGGGTITTSGTLYAVAGNSTVFVNSSGIHVNTAALPADGVTSVATGSGLTGGTITATGTVSVLANNGITANTTGLFVTQGTGTVVNSTGVHVNSAYIGTLSANNSSYLGGVLPQYYVKGTGINTWGYRTTNLQSGAGTVNAASGYSSGFYDGYQLTNMPTSDWYHLIINSHYNSGSGNQYEFHIATAFWDTSNFYMRSISPSGIGSWRTLLHNGNYNSYAPTLTGTGASGTWSISINGSAGSAPNPNAITFNNGGAGAASGSTYTGSSTLTVSYNTVGAPSTSGTNASGTWSININGSAASATNASAATSATNATTQSTTGSTNFSVGTLVYSANTQGGRTYETHDFNSYPNLYSTMFINPTGSTNVPAGFSGNGYRFIMGAGDTTTRGFDLLGSSAPALWFRAREQGTWNQVVYNSGTWSININGTAGSAPNPNAVTFNNGGAGAASGSTYTGSATLTVSYNTVGAPSTTGTNASGTWSISINGSAASATNASAATNATTATNWGTYGAVPAAGSSGGTASTIPRSDVNGYTYFGYINSSTGNSENPAVSQVIVTNGTDNFYRKSAIASFTTYLSGTASSLTAGAATNASFATNATSATNASYQGPTGTSNDWVTSFQNTPAHYRSFREMSANGPSGTWWFMENMRHSNGSNYWGRQNAWGWEDNANEYYSRNITSGTFGSWVRFLNSSNYNSYAPTLTGTGASGTWSISINGSAASATNASAATNATNASNLGGVAAASYAQLSGATFTGTVSVPTGFTIRKQDNANEGGEFYIEKATNSTLSGNIIIDNNVNTLRIFENGGSFRGATLDITGCGSPSALLHSSNYNSYAPTLTGTGASGTWSININGSAASATNASAATNATTATNQSGGTVSATTGSFSSDLSFNSGYGSAAVAYGCRVWIRFVVSAGVPAISNDGNVSTITDNGVGNFVINFTTALVDANYAAVANYSETNSATGGGNDGQASCHTYATGSVRIFCARGDGSANDPQRCSLIVCR